MFNSNAVLYVNPSDCLDFLSSSPYETKNEFDEKEFDRYVTLVELNNRKYTLQLQCMDKAERQVVTLAGMAVCSSGSCPPSRHCGNCPFNPNR